MTFSKLKAGEKLIDRYKLIPDSFNSRTPVIDKLVNIPATYWGEIESKDEKKMWWKTNTYDKPLNKLTPDQMKRTILYGKVLQKAKTQSCYEVILMNAKDEISMIPTSEIRNFLYDDGGGKPKATIDRMITKKSHLCL